MPTSKARERLADILNEVVFRGRRVVLHRHGKNIAALIPVKDLEVLRALEDRIDTKAAKDALAEPGPSIPWEEVKAKLKL
jgi:prevent-host-death family protein